MRFFAITSILALSVSALPTADNSVIARDASPEAIADALVESAARLQARDKDIAYASMPTKSAACPATARYGAHTYTDNQIKVAFLGGCGLNAKGKQLGTNNYPHTYNSNQELPNGCGTATQEFPILTSNNLYVGEAVTDVPDRVLYEVKDKGKVLNVKYCGVIRHGDGRDFVNCP